MANTFSEEIFKLQGTRADTPLVDIYDGEINRAGNWSFNAPFLSADLARQSWSKADLERLLAFGMGQGFEDKRAAFLGGEAINISENRAALHWLERAQKLPERASEHLKSEFEAVKSRRTACSDFVSKALSGNLGFKVRTILHIGIGGSDLGPRFIYDALKAFRTGPEIRFCANIDPEDFYEAIEGLNPATTLAIVVSKSFTTPETLSNARLALNWLKSGLKEDELSAHLCAISSAPDKAMIWGADEAGIFPMSETVGGRYSSWSSVGLSLQIAMGQENWRAFLSGAEAMDRHFADAPLETNLPFILGLLDIWNHTICRMDNRIVLPYSHRLKLLSSYLQQLEMESNGKTVQADGASVTYPTSPMVWGSSGTNGQHSFHQLLHQGTRAAPVEFLLVKGGTDEETLTLYANALAQAEVMMRGRDVGAIIVEDNIAESQARQKAIPGGRPSSFMLLKELTPSALGALLALYEHRSFSFGSLLGLNPFDQWGVEYGKVMAENIRPSLISGHEAHHSDATTKALVEQLSKSQS